MTTKSIAAIRQTNLVMLALSIGRSGVAVITFSIIALAIGTLMLIAGVLCTAGASAWWLFTLPGRAL